MSKKLTFHAELQSIGRIVGIYAYYEDKKRLMVARQVEFYESEPNFVRDPFLQINPSEAQNIMDEFWRIGFRPSEGTGSAGALSATQDHLKDLRTLLFHKEGLK